jgi:cation transport regulator ChaB
MPYSSINELPDYIRKYSKKLQKIFLNVFNNAYKQYGDESKAFAVANGVIKRYKESHSFDYRDNILESLEGFLSR